MAVKAGHSERMKKHVFEMKGLRKILRVSWTAKETKLMIGFLTKSKKTVRHRQSKETSILWSHHEETKELSGERTMPHARR